MARLLGPDANGRLVYAVTSGALVGAPAKTATVYTDAAGTTLASIATYDGTATPGATIAGSTVTVDAYSMLPRFWFPDGVDTVYVSVNGGPVTAVNADYDARLDNVPVLDSGGKIPAANMRPYNNRGVVAASTAYAVWDLAVYKNQRVLMTTANTSNSTGFISAANYTILGPATWYNVKDYGAKGDASTDDTAAIQAAIDAAAATAQSTFGGGTVFLPAGMYITSATLVLKKHVWLRGEGQNTTTIKLATNANCHVVQNDIAASGSGTNADCVGLVDICLDGNKANQNGAGPYYGVRLETNPAVTGASGDSFFDMHHTLLNVRVYKAKGDGFHFVGRSAIQVINAFASTCDGYGFFSTFDTNYSHCESDSAGKAGFYLNNGSIRLAACKAYLSGQADGLGAGFELGSNASGVGMAACEAQNNQGQGFYLNGANRCVVQGVADSNNYNVANSYVGVELLNASNNLIDVVCWQGTQGGSQVGHQSNALRVTGTSTANTIVVSHAAAAGASVGTALTDDTVLASSSVTVNGVSVTRTLATDTDVAVSSLADGQVLTYEAATGKWKNLPSGSTAFLAGAFGDGSDGTVTLDGTATVGWASKSGSTYTMTKDAYTSSLTVQSGVTLIPAGYRIFCTGTVSNAGTIAANGNDASSFTGASGTGTGALSGGRSGGTGNTGAGSGGTAGGTGMASAGAGGTGSSGAAGSGGASQSQQTTWLRQPQPILSGVLNVFSTVLSVTGGGGGGGGGGDGTNRGGGGGSGGGVIAILAHGLVNTGSLSVRGGNGFTPTTGNCGGGGGGAGGVIVLYTLSAWTNSGTTTVTGGTAGSGVGTGGAGSNGGNGSTLNAILQ